jgi:predicted dehydrogenase
VSSPANGKRYRVGVLGASFGGAVHVPAFVAQGRFDVVAIALSISKRRTSRHRT